QLSRDIMPSARRVTALANANDPFSKPFLEQMAAKPPELQSTLSGSAAVRSLRPLSHRWRKTGPMPSSFNPACRANALPSWRPADGQTGAFDPQRTLAIYKTEK